MADVQIENGFTRLANELLEVVMSQKFNGTQFKIVLAIWRYTYGFKRKQHEFSLTFLSNATNIHKQQIKTELDKLIEMKVITVVENSTFTKSRTLSFNKDYSQWLCLQSVKKQTVSENTYTTVSELTYTTVSESTYQERKNKENNKETVNQAFDEFWAIYKKRKNRANAIKKFEAQFKKHGKEKIINGAKSYMNEMKDTDMKYIKNPDTFLNQQTFLDYEATEEKESTVDKEKLIKGLRNRKRDLERELEDGIESFKTFGNENVFYQYEKELREINERLRGFEKED